MSFNRLIYDKCHFQKRTREAIGTLEYQLYTGKYKNCQSCFTGQAVPGFMYDNNRIGQYNLYSGKNIERSNARGVHWVDIENDLFGKTRVNSLCPHIKYKPYSRQVGTARKGMPPELCPRIKTNMIRHLHPPHVETPPACGN